MTESEVLTVLSGLQPYDLSGLEFCVITNSLRAENNEVTNLAAGSYWPFERGEILIVDKVTGREPFGEGRKPAKWDLEAEYVATLDEARAIRDRVLAA